MLGPCAQLWAGARSAPPLHAAQQAPSLRHHPLLDAAILQQRRQRAPRAHAFVRSVGSAGSTSTAVGRSDSARAPASQQLDPQQQQQQQQQPQQPVDDVQEVRGLRELVLQQQSAIAQLQQEVQQLRAMVLPADGTGQQLPAASRQRLLVPDIQPQQPGQPVQTFSPLGGSGSSGGSSSGGSSGSSSGSSGASSSSSSSGGGSAYQPMSIETFRALPDKIVLVRHAESQGNVDARTYSSTPDYEVPLSARGWEQAVACGSRMRAMMEAEHGPDYKLFFMTSPYCRTRQTFVGVRQAFPDANFAGVQEEVQLREQDFGNFQDPAKIQADLAERNRFGRFYYRFPDGESGSDVYNRISIFEDHLIRDMKAGRFSATTSLVLVTHGLTMRVFLMRWFSWTVESFLQVYNPPNATPIVVEKINEVEYSAKAHKLREKRQTMQVKQAYRLRSDSKQQLKMSMTATTDPVDLVGQEWHA